MTARFVLDTVIPPDSYDTVCVDLDDTIIDWDSNDFRGDIAAFLNCKEMDGKKIILVTRSNAPWKTLKRFDAADWGHYVFDAVYSVHDEPKSNFCPLTSIFIDNDPNERLEVSTALGIPCIDPNDTELFRGIPVLPTTVIQQPSLQNFSRLARRYFHE